MIRRLVPHTRRGLDCRSDRGRNFAGAQSNCGLGSLLTVPGNSGSRKENALRPYRARLEEGVSVNRLGQLSARGLGVAILVVVVAFFGSLMGAGFASGQSLLPGDGSVSGLEARDVSVNSACVG